MLVVGCSSPSIAWSVAVDNGSTTPLVVQLVDAEGFERGVTIPPAQEQVVLSAPFELADAHLLILNASDCTYVGQVLELPHDLNLVKVDAALNVTTEEWKLPDRMYLANEDKGCAPLDNGPLQGDGR
jgi:hypothetical protein